MTPNVRARLATVVRVALVIGLLGACALFVRNLDPRRVARALADVSVPFALAAALLNLSTVWWRSARFGAMLGPRPGGGGAVPTRRLVAYHFSAFAANNLLPGRAGEVLRVWLISRREGFVAASVVSTVLVEKLLDGLGLLAVIAPVPLLLPALPRSAAIAIGVVAALGLAGVVAALVGARFDLSRRPRLARFAPLLDGLRLLTRRGSLARALATTLGLWLTDATMAFLCVRALHLDVPPSGALLMLLAVNVASALPSTPGQVGVFEAGAVKALVALSVAPEPAMAAALLYHLVQVVPVTLLGLPGLRLATAARRASSPPGMATEATGS